MTAKTLITKWNAAIPKATAQKFSYETAPGAYAIRLNIDEAIRISIVEKKYMLNFSARGKKPVKLTITKAQYDAMAKKISKASDLVQLKKIVTAKPQTI